MHVVIFSKVLSMYYVNVLKHVVAGRKINASSLFLFVKSLDWIVFLSTIPPEYQVHLQSDFIKDWAMNIGEGTAFTYTKTKKGTWLKS